MSDRAKILIVEDELLIAKVLRMQLEAEGHEVRNVSDADHAVNFSVEWEPQLIVMDVYLKHNTSGINAAKRIRKAGLNVPVIFTTGNSTQSTLEEIGDMTNFSLMAKPVNYTELSKKISECLSIN